MNNRVIQSGNDFLKVFLLVRFEGTSFASCCMKHDVIDSFLHGKPDHADNR